MKVRATFPAVLLMAVTLSAADVLAEPAGGLIELSPQEQIDAIRAAAKNAHEEFKDAKCKYEMYGIMEMPIALPGGTAADRRPNVRFVQFCNTIIFCEFEDKSWKRLMKLCPATKRNHCLDPNDCAQSASFYDVPGKIVFVGKPGEKRDNNSLHYVIGQAEGRREKTPPIKGTDDSKSEAPGMGAIFFAQRLPQITNLWSSVGSLLFCLFLSFVSLLGISMLMRQSNGGVGVLSTPSGRQPA